MLSLVGVLLVAGYVAAVPSFPTDCPMICTADYRPICGSDGQTYSNECEMRSTACLERRAIEVTHEGECEMFPRFANPCMKRCTKIYMPVCGSDGKTYGNQCTFEIGVCEMALFGKKLVLLRKGEC